MKFVILILLGAAKFNDAALKWSSSYSYEAILSVPDSDILEPYEVWFDGTTGNTRIDFYNGLDKMYRLRLFGTGQDEEQKFIYYKMYPESISATTNIQVCQRIQANQFRLYSPNTYLPTTQNFSFQGIEQINGLESEKWQTSRVRLEDGVSVTFTYTIWVDYDKLNNTVPRRYEYRVSAGKVLIDNFRHDYISYSAIEPDKIIFELPDVNVLPCSEIKLNNNYEPYDPLLEYIDPMYRHAKIKDDFERFKLNHNKTYLEQKENFVRLNNFRRNLRYINSQNRMHSSFTLAINHLADANDDEMAVYFGTKDHFDEYEELNEDDDSIEEDQAHVTGFFKNFDWRDYGAVTSVKVQTAMCRSCYAFATAAAVESSKFIQNGFEQMLEVSEQAIIDCSWRVNREGNYGCSGGSIRASLEWIKNRGIPYRDDYGRYLALEGRCHAPNVTRHTHIRGYHKVIKDERTIKRYLRKRGPLAIAIYSNPKSFMFYSSGVFNDGNCKREKSISGNHGLLLIGYGEEENGEEKFWTLKNSYGTKWGEKGYIRIAIKNNICGVMDNVYSVRF
ncbi:hypothetical protein evm_012124 [Chilo suppressalis]|nr:hypothetical protein evm_012124 [Chilo suppressalis]